MSSESLRVWNLVLLASAAAALLAGGAALVIRPRHLPKPWTGFLKKHEQALTLLRRPWRMVLPLAISLFTQGSFTVLTSWIGKSSGLDLPFPIWLFTWSLAKVVALLPVTLSGIGTREIALVTLLKPFGVATAPALVIGLAWDAILIAGSLAAGLISSATAWLTPAADVEVRN